MKMLKYPKNLIIGKNNYIEKGVKILENVIIGNNNKIYSGTIIYPNTKIGNNNVILNNNIIGEHPVEAKEVYNAKIFGGVEIGNNNFFHVNNLIFNGYYRKTIINDNNKLLAECHIGHDTNISDNVVLYPRVITGGITTLMNYSTMGMGSFIQQNSVLGKYSMIGMGNIASHNVFPYFIYFNQKYLRFNKVKIPEKMEIDKYENDIRNLIEDLKKNNCDIELVKKYNLPKNILDDIYEFINLITIKKI
jgi:acyl-[acyl carrier protein]--UDP-N-acetylglucosamine O-acyltransferase